MAGFPRLQEMPQRAQPHNPAKIDRANHFGRSVVFAAVAYQPDSVTSVRAEPLSNGRANVFERGKSAYSTSGASGGYYWTLPSNSPLYSIGTEHTILVVARIDALNNEGALFSVPYTTTHVSPYKSIALGMSAPNTSMSMFWTVGGSFDQYVVASVAETTQPHVYAGSRSGSTGAIYRDGVLMGSGTSSFSRSGAVDFNTKQPASVLNRNKGDAGGEGVNGHVALAIVLNRALSAAEHAALAQNPYQVFQNTARIFAFAPAAGGATAVPVFRHHYVQQGIG